MESIVLRTMPVPVRQLFKAYENELTKLETQISQRKKDRDILTKENSDLLDQNLGIKKTLSEKEKVLLDRIAVKEKEIEDIREETSKILSEVKQNAAQTEKLMQETRKAKEDLSAASDKVESMRIQYEKLLANLKEISQYIKSKIG